MWHQEAYNFLLGNMRPRKIDLAKDSNEGYDPNIQPAHCATFEHLIDCISQKLHLTQGMIDTLAVMLAVNLSVKLGDVPIWTYVVGPPSSGKTTLAEYVGAAYPFGYSISKITGIFSGFRTPTGDASMLPKFQGKNVIMKDFTSILKLPAANQDAIYADLRELSDGAANVQYRNAIGMNYTNVRFSMTACVTNVIRAKAQSELGERFICTEIDSNWSNEGFLSRYVSGTNRTDMAFENMRESLCEDDVSISGKHIDQKCHTYGFIETMHQTLEDKLYKDTIVHNTLDCAQLRGVIDNFGRWTAMARANVERDRNGTLLYRPQTEDGTRLSKTLMKLAVCLCLTFRIMEPDDRIERIIRKVALDTAINFKLETMLALAHCKVQAGLTTSELATVLGISPTSTGRIIADLRELGVLSETSVSTGYAGGGAPNKLFRLAPSVNTLAKGLGFC